MNNQFTQGPIIQGTTLGPVEPNQLITGQAFQQTAQACIVDLTAPTFDGIGFLTRGALGQLRASWSAASDTSNPIKYEVYVKPLDSINLFSPINIALITSQLSADVFALGNNTLLQTGVKYFVGVRAVDAVGNRDVNLVSLSQTSPGITGATNAQISGVFAVDAENNLIATFWVTDSEGVINNPARLGPASYVIYDNNGNLVPSMSESGIAFDSEGFFEITPIPSVLSLENTFYTVKVAIPVDGVQIVYNLPITYPEPGPHYEPRAVFSIDASNRLQASIWITKNGEQMRSNIGLASYSILSKDGLDLGISETNISADASGLFKTSPVLANLLTDLNHYTAVIEVTADGVSRKGVIGITVAE
jgi:hypothetical protein